VPGTARTPARTTRAALFAVVAVALVTALRARSDGPRPDLLLLVAAAGLVALLARPLTGRERRLPALIGGLIGVQLILRSTFLLASTGHLAHGSTGLICSPAAAGPSSASCLPTDRGGFALLTVQLIAAVVLAVWLRDVEAVAWSLARLFGRGLTRVTAAVRTALALLMALTSIGLAAALTPARPARSRRRAADASHRRLAVVSRTRGRRGPPVATPFRARTGPLLRAVNRCRIAFASAPDAALLTS
jgi:hypothetical protein